MRRSSPGFTLLELLIAITLLALVVVVAVESMRLGMRTVEKGDRKILGLERDRTSLAVIQAQLQSSFTVAETEALEGETPPQFRVEGGLVEFRSYYSLWGGSKGPVIVSYRVADDGPGRISLRLSETPVFMAAGREALLIEQADAIKFEFFQKSITDEKGQWVEQWDEKNRLPPKVRVTITKGRRIMTMLIPIRLSAAGVQTVPGAPANDDD